MMTWLAIGRWILARLPQILIAAGAGLLLWTAAEWWAGVRAAPLRAQIATLQADLTLEQQRTTTANETARLRAMAAQREAEVKHREDSHEIDRLLERESALLAAVDADRADFARRLREQWQAGR